MNILAILALLVALGFSLLAATRFWVLDRNHQKRACLGLAFLTASLAFATALHLASLLVWLWGIDAHLLIVYRWVMAGSIVGQGWLVLTDLVPSLKRKWLVASVFVVFAAVVVLTALGLTAWAELVNAVFGLMLFVGLYRNIQRSAPPEAAGLGLGTLSLPASTCGRFGGEVWSFLSQLAEWHLLAPGLGRPGLLPLSDRERGDRYAQLPQARKTETLLQKGAFSDTAAVLGDPLSTARTNPGPGR